MLIPGVAPKDTVVLVDTNVMIEAVRTRCWNALTGSLRLETVEECRDEAGRGSYGRSGYVAVSQGDLGRLSAVHPVTGLEARASGSNTRTRRTWIRASATSSPTRTGAPPAGIMSG